MFRTDRSVFESLLEKEALHSDMDVCQDSYEHLLTVIALRLSIQAAAFAFVCGSRALKEKVP